MTRMRSKKSTTSERPSALLSSSAFKAALAIQIGRKSSCRENVRLHRERERRGVCVCVCVFQYRYKDREKARKTMNGSMKVQNSGKKRK